MPKVYRISDFKRKHAVYVNELFKGDDKYIFIANENRADNSFLITKPGYILDLLIRLKYIEEAAVINDIMASIREKVSKKYRDIRAKR